MRWSIALRCSLESTLEKTTTTPERNLVWTKHMESLTAESLFVKVYLSLLWNKCPNQSKVSLLPDRTTHLGLLCTASAAEAVGLDAMCTTCDMGKKNASLLGKCAV